MKTKKIKLYSIDELSTEAREKALQKLGDINVSYDWWESVYSDASNVGLSISGFDLERHYCSGEFDYDAQETALKIMVEHGPKCETYQDAKKFLAERKALVRKYSTAASRDVVDEENEYDFDNECYDLEEEFRKDLCEDYRIILSKEYDYLTSERSVMETIKANEYSFTVEGDLEK